MGRVGVGAGLGMIARLGMVGGACVLLAQCSQGPGGKLDPKYGVSSSPRLVALGEPVPKGGGTYRVGKPYTIGGRTYEPQENTNYTAEGLASWYGEDFHGRATANGEVYDMASISAAHPTLPIPSYARVTNLGNQKSIIVRINDRGPYHADRLIDVSVRTARLLGFYDRGVTRVRVDYVGRAALEGSDDTKLAATLRSGTPAPGPSEVRVASSRPFLPQTPEQAREYNQALAESFARVDTALARLEGKPLTAEQSETADRIRTFRRQAEQAREQDLVTAVSLARRADLLAKDLLGRLP